MALTAAADAGAGAEGGEGRTCVLLSLLAMPSLSGRGLVLLSVLGVCWFWSLLWLVALIFLRLCVVLCMDVCCVAYESMMLHSGRECGQTSSLRQLLQYLSAMQPTHLANLDDLGSSNPTRDSHHTGRL